MEFDGLSIALAVAIVVVSLLAYLNKAEPDIHPALLEQQASVATIQLVDRQISGFGSGLLKVTGLQPKKEAVVGLFTALSRECFIAQQSLARFSLIAVPIHDPKNTDLLIEVVTQTKMEVIIVSQKTLPLVLDKLSECSSLKTIIVAGIYISPEQLKAASTHNVKLVKFAEVTYSGMKDPIDPVPPEPSDIAMINFNTKSSSLSKGVVLTHANIVAALAAFQAALPGGKRLTNKDRLISHFTAGDVLATVLTAAIISVGGSIVFPTGLMKNILHDAQASCPTIFASTPVILEKIQEALELTYGSGSLFRHAYVAKQDMLKQGHITPSSMWDFLGLSEVRAKLGGKIRLVVTTADPIKPGTMDFFRAGAGVPAIKIYGRTETSGVATCRNLYDYSGAEHAGPPMGCSEIKLLDDPEHGYTAADQPHPRGEILVRGPNVMKGYFKKPNTTSAVVDSEGWFHTGEIGQLLDNGTLEVLGKKKKSKKHNVE
ncbi:hypothetical protein BGW41_005598 [Actinomortierella wolfii]|nr:hypothetical protein BGW41_005598 [Actinomortierella wolfii]